MMKIKTFMILLAVSLCPARDVLADTVDIREWFVPWEDSEPGHVYVDTGGRVWFAGERDSYIGNFAPDTGEFNRYDLGKGTVPTALVVDANRNIWFANNKGRQIGSLNPATGRVQEFPMPDRKAKDPHSIILDRSDNVWFSVEDGNFLGRLQIGNSQIDLIPLQTRKIRPQGIVLDSNGDPWVAAAGENVLLHVSYLDLSVTEIRTPNDLSRFRRLAATSDDNIWYADFELGNIGRYNPQFGEFKEWALPGGPDSRPHGMAVDRNDRLWVVETGSDPNRLIGFDTASETFLTETDIPSGAGSVSDMHYYEAAGEMWFGTRSNYIGRAKVH